MASLREICIATILKHDLIHTRKIPEDLELRIFCQDVKNTCGTTVSKLRLIEESREMEVQRGGDVYLNGLQKVIQESVDIAWYAKTAEKAMNEGIHNCCSIKNVRMFSYLNQEPHFVNWQPRTWYHYIRVLSEKDVECKCLYETTCECEGKYEWKWTETTV